MLRAKDFRNEAWQKLSGKWGTLVLATLVYDLILGVCGGLSLVGIGAIVVLIITGPLSVGLAILSMQVIRNAPVKFDTLFEGFKMFERSFILYLINYIFITLWSLLFIIPGIIKALSYGMSYYILIDNPQLSANDARKKSMEIMHGNKWRLFCLQFSFIGWHLLSLLTFGILYFWVTPYMQTATAAFYQDLINRNNPQPQYGETVVAEEPFVENNTDNTI